jgi:hypothetical protein
VYRADEVLYGPASILKRLLERFVRGYGADLLRETVFTSLEFHLGGAGLRAVCKEYLRATSNKRPKEIDGPHLVKMGVLLAADPKLQVTPAAALVADEAKGIGTPQSTIGRLAGKFFEKEALYRATGELQYCQEQFFKLTGYPLFYILAYDRSPLDQLIRDDPSTGEKAAAVLRRHEEAYYRPIGAAAPPHRRPPGRPKTREKSPPLNK